MSLPWFVTVIYLKEEVCVSLGEKDFPPSLNCRQVSSTIISELKHATFLSHRRKPAVNMPGQVRMPGRCSLPDFQFKLTVSASEKIPDSPRCSRLRRSYLITPLDKYSCQYGHPSKSLSYAPALSQAPALSFDWTP